MMMQKNNLSKKELPLVFPLVHQHLLVVFVVVVVVVIVDVVALKVHVIPIPMHSTHNLFQKQLYPG
jgi:hypothetical protein